MQPEHHHHGRRDDYAFQVDYEDAAKRAEADILRKKLSEECKKVREVSISDKNPIQKIRLIVNLLAPDNLEKKFGELRGIMFGSLKLPDEEGYDN